MSSEEKTLGIIGMNKTILRLIRMYKFKFFLISVCILISIAFTVICPILLGDAINIILDGSVKILNHTGTIDFLALYNLLILLIVLYLVSALFSYLQSYFLNRASTDIVYALREQMVTKVLELPMGSVDENKRGDIISTFSNDIDLLHEALTSQFTYYATTLVTLALTLIIMIMINLWLTIAIVVVVLCSCGLIAIVVKISQKYFNKQIGIMGATTGMIEEMFSGQEVIRSLNYEERAIEEFNGNADEWYTHEWKSGFIASLNTPIMDFNSNLGYVLVAILGGIFVLQGTMSVGRILTFFEYLKNFTNPIKDITSIIPELQAGLSSADRIFNFLEMDIEENPSDKEPLVIIASTAFWGGIKLQYGFPGAMLYFISMCCVGFLEEVIFRGLLFKAMEKDNLKTAIIVSSLTFGLGHIVNLVNGSGKDAVSNIVQIMFAVLVGFVLVLIFYYGKSLIPCILFHSANNALKVFSAEGNLSPQTEMVLNLILIFVVLGGYAFYLIKTFQKDN